MPENDDPAELIRTEIRGRTEMYHLISRRELDQYGERSLADDVTFVLGSILFGVWVSQSSADRSNELVIVAAFALAVSLFFHYGRWKLARQIKSSGIVRRFEQSPGEVEGLRILKATYGARGLIADVTAVLRGLIADDRLSLKVENDVLGGDPIEDVEKDLTVVYVYKDTEVTRQAHEHDTLVLP